MEITIKQMTPVLLGDYLSFFDNIVFSENPDWSDCYCYSFHFTGKSEEWKKETNRSSVIELINMGLMTGYLAYSDNKVVGWCNANNRNNYQGLTIYNDLVISQNDNVGSIVCFVINPEYRRRGIAQKILEQICLDYSSMDYDYLEAYPGKGNLSSEKHYKGPVSMYEKCGFKITYELDRNYVVRKMLK